MRHQIVIGAGYGDEGKGRMIDYFANLTPNQKLVVRFNGGSQAGHNVVLANGHSHIHSHLASGSLSNHDSYLSKYFVCSPKAFLQEWHSLDTYFKVYVDPDAKVTTPYDMIINQLLETKRGSGRHGSVGVGFGETIERYENFGTHNFFLQPRKVIKVLLEDIRDNWFRPRCQKLGLNYKPYIGQEIIDDFLDDFESFSHKIRLAKLSTLYGLYEQILFEGAQGLMLDMDYGAFPYVTRSNTGLKNAVEIIKTLENQDYDVCYVTRSYTTRHGAGPLQGEDNTLRNLLETSKETNVPSTYQGTIRYAPLNIHILRNAIDHDLVGYKPAKFQLALTCIDQWKNKYDQGRYLTGDASFRDVQEWYLGSGPNRENTDAHKI